MKILWICEKPLDVSVDHVTWTEMVHQLQHRKHEVLLATGFRRTKPDFKLGESIHYLPSIKKPILRYISFCIALFFFVGFQLMVRRPDIMIVHPYTVLPLLPFGIFRKMRLIRTRFLLDIRTIPVEMEGITGLWKVKEFNISIHMVKYLFDGISVITPFMSDVIRDQYKFKKRDIGIWTSAASLEKFLPDDYDVQDIRQMKNEMNLKDKFIIIYHGIMSRNRGLQQAVEAIRIVTKSHQDIVLLFLGDGAAKHELRNMVEYYGLENHVRFQGSVPHDLVPKYLMLADIGILPFPDLLWWRVSSPIKLMEYLAMGKPVLVTDIEAHRDVLLDNPVAFFMKDSQPANIAKAIMEAYGKRYNFTELSHIARKVVEDQYTWEHQSKCFEKYLASII